jgi:hypothetical protein
MAPGLNGAEHVDHAGNRWKLGNLEPSRLRFGWTPYGSVPATPVIPRAEWPDRIKAFAEGPDFPFLPPVHDQDGLGQCNPEAVAGSLESCRMEQGLPPVVLSAGDLYGRINSGRDKGSYLEDAMSEIMAHGVGSADSYGGTLWIRGKSATESERQRYRVIEAFICPTFDHLISAVISGFRVISGLMWCSNFTPDSAGWLPRPGQAEGGHAVFGYKPAMRTVGGQVQYGIWHQNSWRTSYGIGGRMILPEYVYNRQLGGWWALRDVVDEGGVIPAPVP